MNAVDGIEHGVSETEIKHGHQSVVDVFEPKLVQNDGGEDSKSNHKRHGTHQSVEHLHTGCQNGILEVRQFFVIHEVAVQRNARQKHAKANVHCSRQQLCVESTHLVRRFPCAKCWSTSSLSPTDLSASS